MYAKNIGYFMDKLTYGFKLPIQHLDNKYIHKLQPHVSSDLELVSGLKDDGKPMYDHLFRPSNTFGKNMIPEWGKQITSNTDFLMESQNIILEHSSFLEKTKDSSSECDEIIQIWDSIKKDPRFLDKYYYMEWEMLKYLNESPAFLQGMSLIHLLSPITTVIVPLLSLIVPFIILKIQGISIDFSTYISVLKDIAKHNIIGKTILSVQNMTNANFMYIIMSVAFYCIQMYNNIISFFKYYRNIVNVNNHICSMKKYVGNTILKMQTFVDLHGNKLYHSSFCANTRFHISVLQRLYNTLDCVDPFAFTISKFCSIGYMMKCYYSLYADPEYEESLLYSMGFEGYIDNLNGIYENYLGEKINIATYDTAKNTGFVEIYYPAYNDSDKCVKNNCNFDKNMIITGVNASGKTTMLKATTLNLIFTQQIGMGFYSSMNLKKPYTHIHSYLNIPDTSERDSLFQAEARRCKEIIDSIHGSGEESNHFCIFDELYSGTNPVEASKSAYAFLVYLAQFNNVEFMLTTHYTSICKKCKATGKIRNYKMDVERNDNDEFVYSYSMKPGICYLEGGVEILKSMDYPDEIIKTIMQYDNKPRKENNNPPEAQTEDNKHKNKT